MPTFHIRHVTTYRYRNPVVLGEHRIMLRPREAADQRTIERRLAISPDPISLGWSEDASGNLVGHARFGRRAAELRFEAALKVEQEAFREDDLAIAEHARICPFSYGAEEGPDLSRFIERQHADPERVVDRFARAILFTDPTRDTWSFLKRLNAAIRRDFAYLRREEPGVQSPTHTLRQRSGSCRDFAVLMCEAVRSQGVAARFVSGYLHVRGAEPAERRAGGSTHGWLQVYLPGGGWIDFDPTSGAVGNRDLVRVAVVRDPASASPVSGTFVGFPSDDVGMSVEVDVRVEAA